MPESMKHQGLAYPALPHCKSRIVSVPCTNASSARSGQNLIVSLPHQGVYKKQSGYLRFKVKTITASSEATFKNDAGVIVPYSTASQLHLAGSVRLCLTMIIGQASY